MLYMFLALTTPAGGMSGMSGMRSGPGPTMALHYPTLAFIFALILAGYSVWDLDQLSGRRYSLAAVALPLAGVSVLTPAGAEARPSPAALTVLSPAVTVGCRVTMGVVMAF
jgi:hypothetical protein